MTLDAPVTLTERLRDPRRAFALALLALTGGVVLALLVARGPLAGSDAFAYWTGVHRWLAGADIYQVPAGTYVSPPTALPYAYAPWSLYLFLPWALLPWDFAWFFWRLALVALFAASVAWAYERQPLATAVVVAALSPSIAANFDTGNVNVLIALVTWIPLMPWLRARRQATAGVGWGVATALKFVPAFLIFFMPRGSWRIGLAVLVLLGLLTLATWPLTLRQLEIVLRYPRPFRLDYVMLLWGIVPWLWTRPWQKRALLTP